MRVGWWREREEVFLWEKIAITEIIGGPIWSATRSPAYTFKKFKQDEN